MYVLLFILGFFSAIIAELVAVIAFLIRSAHKGHKPDRSDDNIEEYSYYGGGD